MPSAIDCTRPYNAETQRCAGGGRGGGVRPRVRFTRMILSVPAIIVVTFGLPLQPQLPWLSGHPDNPNNPRFGKRDCTSVPHAPRSTSLSARTLACADCTLRRGVVLALLTVFANYCGVQYLNSGTPHTAAILAEDQSLTASLCARTRGTLSIMSVEIPTRTFQNKQKRGDVHKGANTGDGV